MKHLFIICQRYYDAEFSTITIGGIQTYITNLCQVGTELGFSCRVIQYDKQNRQKDFLYGQVIGVDVSHCKHLRHKNRAVFQRFRDLFNPATDILIYATEGLAQKESKEYAIAIQHGISWDISSNASVSRWENITAIFKNALAAVLLTQHASNTQRMICVDYNFPNWYRTQVHYPETQLTVIPNFTMIAQELPSKQIQDETLHILFARRFQPYRGTRLFANVVKRLLEEYNHLYVTLAGDGPDEQWLKDTLSEFDNVQFVHYASEEAINIHTCHHIAVVPTTGSEGTSLSLLEAMSAQCAVICTNVGGMTNIVIDHYNGLMINPDEESLYKALKSLIDNQELRISLSQKGYETVQSGFSHALWKERWIKVLQEHDPSRVAE